MTNEMNFSEEELESMADKLLEEASVTDISAFSMMSSYAYKRQYQGF